MVASRRQFCFIRRCIASCLPLQRERAYFVFRVNGAGGCEERAAVERDREFGDRLSFGVYLAVHLVFAGTSLSSFLTRTLVVTGRRCS